MGIEQALAGGTTKQGPRIERVGIVEGVALGVLLLDLSPAAFAPELTVESVESFTFGLELVLVACDSPSDCVRVHLDDRHLKSVEPVMVENK